MLSEETKLLTKLAKLRIDRSRGIAPHKPLLLLVVIELAKQKLLTDPRIVLTPEIAYRFSVYWSVVAYRRSQPPDVRLPFHHIGSSGLWSSLDEKGNKSKHRDSTVVVRLSDEFSTALQSEAFRQQAAYLLITNYFELNEQITLFEMVGIDRPIDTDSLDKISREKAVAEGRTARFRVDVVAAYCHTCSLTGYRITTITGHSIVDAAHIHQFADSRNDDPKNGIALCKNAHWLFDLGLWSIDNDFRVIVATDAFDESCPNQTSLTSMAGQPLFLPRDKNLWPDRKNLEWHRKKRFRR